MEEQIQELKQRVEELAEDANFDYSKGENYKIEVTQLIKTIDELLSEDNNVPKKQRIELFYLKGKVSDILPDYSKYAEEALTKAVIQYLNKMKLNPAHSASLNTLGHILWKKRDFTASKQCFETILEKEPNNIKALQYLSIVLRQVGEPKEKQNNFKRSVEIAKKAVMLDFQDAYSWYLVGNAYMSNYFTNPKKDSKELLLGLQAFNQAEKYEKRKNPDLYYNRGNIYAYFEDYELAFKDYRKASEIDPTLIVDELKELEKKVANIFDLMNNKCKISQKKLQNIVKQIPLGLKKQPQGYDQIFTICSFGELTIGINKDKILACKSLVCVTNAQSVPAGFMIVDRNMNFSSLSIYHISGDIYERIHENTDIFVIEPVVKMIECKINGEIIKYLCIQITDVNTLYVDNEKIMQQLAPSMVVNQTFEK